MEDIDWVVVDVGKDAIENRRWMSLCPNYPNLKGVTCEDIDVFLSKLPPQVTKEHKWKEKVREFKKRYEVAYETYQPRDEDYPAAPHIYFWYSKDGDGAVIHREFKQFLRDTLPKELAEDFISKSHGVDDLYQFASRADQEWDEKEMTWLDLPSKEFAIQYLQNIKVYDRDEMYEAMKQIGDQLAGRVWNEMEEYNRKRILFAHHLPQSDVTLNFEDYNEEARNYIKRNVLNNTGTAYITSPRGGHEMLSIFAYANNIKKENIPSDIEKTGTGMDLQGLTWLDNPSAPIKRLVYIDDIVASGEQLKKLTRTLKRREEWWKLTNVDLLAVHLCHRKTPTQFEWHNDEYHKDAVDLHKNRSLFDVKTIGIKQAQQEFREGGIRGNVTCMFPHACPDGDSDWLLQRLYDSPRCSPERRIARRDM